jgi:hypothetical protein
MDRTICKMTVVVTAPISFQTPSSQKSIIVGSWSVLGRFLVGSWSVLGRFLVRSWSVSRRFFVGFFN